MFSTINFKKNGCSFTENKILKQDGSPKMADTVKFC